MIGEWSEHLFGFQFADPWMLLFAALLPVANLIRRWRGRPAVASGSGRFFAAAPRTWRVRAAFTPGLLQGLGFLLLVVALARPVHRDRLPLRTEGIDILLCLDASSSMNETDMDPSQRQRRVDVAKETAAQFLAERTTDRVGLLTFGSFPNLRCPLTLDHLALRTFLDQVDCLPPNTPEDGTRIGLAASRCAQILKSSTARSKVVILLTDGQENPDPEIAPLVAARLCKEFGVKIYAIAAGLGQRLPFGGFRPLALGELKQMAERTGGEFYHAKDKDALRLVYEEIDELERTELKDPRYRVDERFLPFLLWGLAAWLFGVLLRGTVFQELL
jgi:Ca-activated chloride channel family protein